ncbi:MAG TPA: hypothetical protein VF665_18640 [Longimicrobium sp.]|uniref:hypothetical protein n=1 Tax=Longimicrobium sp. TaxID=2029185 RepID=UPI002EDA4105
MPNSILRRAVVLSAFLCVAAGACKKSGSDAAAGPVQVDTTNDDWQDGMSASQVQDSARALSPEEAAQAGLSVDTTIHLEQLDARDSVLSQQGRVSAPARGPNATAPAPIDTTAAPSVTPQKQQP